MKLVTYVKEEMPFKEKVYGRTDGRTKNKDRIQYPAQVS